MKHLLILAILLVFDTEVSAQKPWKWTRLKGPNVGKIVNSLASSSSSIISLIRGANQKIIAQDIRGYYFSNDNGKTWDYQTVLNDYQSSGANQYAALIITNDGSYYFAFSTQDPNNQKLQGVYKSSDVGNTWKKILSIEGIYQLFAGSNNSVLVVNSNKLPASGTTNLLFETIDGGLSWTELFNFNGSYYTISASNDKGIFFDGNYKLPPGGQKVTYFGAGTKFSQNQTDMTMIKDSMLLLTDGLILYLSDGESTWDSIGTYKNIWNLTKGNGDTIMANTGYTGAGEYYFLMSTNQGRDWTRIADLSNIDPSFNGYSYDVNYQDPTRLLFQNTNALFLSTDRGSSWKEIGMPFATVSTTLVFGDQIFANYYYQGDQNYVFTSISTDKGESWIRKTPSTTKVYQIGKITGNRIMCVSYDSANAGTYIWLNNNTLPSGWEKRSSIENLFLYYSNSVPLIASDASKYDYISRGSNIYRSDDNAFSWINLNVPDDGSGIYSLDASSDGTLYYGTFPIMYRSDDHGATWTKLEPITDVIKLSYIKTFGSAGVLLGTEGDGLLLSNDKGNSWSRVDGKNFDTVTCIAINSKGEIAAGTNRGLWISDTSKHNWSKVTLGRDDYLYIGGIDVSQNDDFYVGTYGSSVWKGTRNYNAVNYSPSTHSGMQISPNPTNGKITVSIDALNEEQIRLELYDILGRRVAVLADGRYSGENQVSFNTSDLANGIYTLVLSGAQNAKEKIVVQH